jgi:hypothetical protein
MGMMPSEGELAAAGASIILPSSGSGGWSSPLADTGTLGLGLVTTPTPANAGEATVQADQTQLKTDMTTLQTEMAAINATSTVTPGMEATVQADLNAVKSAASVAPNASDVATLKSDMTTALTNSGGPTANQISQVYLDEAAVYASEGVNATLIQKLQSAQSSLLSASGITGTEEGTLYADEQVVEADQTKLQTDVEAITPTTTTTTTTGNGNVTTSAAIPDGGGMRGFGNFGGPAGY